MNPSFKSKFSIIFLFFSIQFVVDFASANEDGFHFANRHFNDKLIREMTEMTGSNNFLDHIRVRRSPSDKKADTGDQKCAIKHKNPFDNCCMDQAKDMEKQKKMRMMRRQCYKEVRGNQHDTVNVMSCDHVNKAKEDFLCIAQCVGQKLNVVDAKGNFIDSNILKHVEDDVAPSSWQRSIAKDVSERCIAEAKAGGDGFINNLAKTTMALKCNPAPIKFSFCLWREFMKACPKERQSKEPQCIQLMKELNQNGEHANENSKENDDSYEDDE